MAERSTNGRREFLLQLGSLLATAAATPLSFALDRKALSCPEQGAASGKGSPDLVPGSAKSFNYNISSWTGDHFELGHRLRIRDLPPKIPAESERKVDFVIIGGGVSGLAAAYYLKDHDFLLLEQYDELGGQSIGSTYKGVDYSMGAAYIGQPQGIVRELFSELSLSPEILPDNHNSFYAGGKWLSDIQTGQKESIYKEFQRFFAEAQPVFKSLPSDDSPELIVSTLLAALDNSPFSQSLKGYSSQFCSLVENVLKSACCGTSTQLSALAGFWLMLDLVSTDCVFKGGNSAIPRALMQKIALCGAQRCLTGSFVWQVELKADGASVVYTSKDGSAHRLDCRHVIVTAPPLVAARILKNIDDHLRGNLLFFSYGSYLVANCLLDKKIFEGTYDNFVSSPFTFADLVVAETPYILSDTYKRQTMGSVLTIYQPYVPASKGRGLLYQGNREEFATSICDQLCQLVEHLDKQLRQVVLTRWGHAMPVAGPGYFQRIQKINALTTGPFSLAHNSMQGLPCAESAIRAARAAANRALRVSARISAVVDGWRSRSGTGQ